MEAGSPVVLAAVGVLVVAAALFWLWRNPACPRCGARKWDRYAVRPLLLCRNCAARVEPSGRKRR